MAEEMVRPEECIGEVMSNFDHQIDHDIAIRLKEEDAHADYPGWNFHGTVWWLRDRNQWVCQVKVYGSVWGYVTADTLEEVMEEVCSHHGRA